MGRVVATNAPRVAVLDHGVRSVVLRLVVVQASSGNGGVLGAAGEANTTTSLHTYMQKF